MTSAPSGSVADGRRIPTYWTLVPSNATSDIPLFELKPCYVGVGHVSHRTEDTDT